MLVKILIFPSASNKNLKTPYLSFLEEKLIEEKKTF